MSKRREEIGRIILSQRVKLGISQARLASLVGVSRQMIQQYEKGSQPDPDKQQVLADALQLSVSIFDPLLSAVARIDSATEYYSIPVYELETYVHERRGSENMLGTLEGTDREVLQVDVARHKCFAVRMTDDSMSPLYERGDVLLINPALEPRDACRVLASFADERAIVRTYTFRGVDRKGSSVFDLSTPNPDHVTVTVNSENPAKIEGVVVERRTTEFVP